MTRLRSLVLLLVLVGFTMVPAVPAQAGNWAVTVLDPVPTQFEAGQGYTIGYWVLQHASHPYQGNLGRTGLRLVGPDGAEAASFTGVALPEVAHYAVAIAAPGAGTWRVMAVQGIFAEHEVGTLTVPGGLTITPPEQRVGPLPGDPSPWGAIHPPGFGAGTANPGTANPGTAKTQAAGAPQEREVQNTAALPAPRSSLAIGLLVFAGAVVLVGLGVGTLRRLRG